MPTFQLPTNLERYLASLSKLYGQKGERSLQSLLVNAQLQILEGHEEYTDFGSTSYGHALRLVLPESIFLSLVDDRDTIRERIRVDLNALHNYDDEYISRVYLEMDLPENADWRQDSGLLVAAPRQVSTESQQRIWTEGNFRVFLSHKAAVKVETRRLADALEEFGISTFVAHVDIQPTKPWQTEIENALATMDAFVALLTPDFHESDWTDQEVGYALARSVPMVAVRLGRDPYGFLGKFQGLSATWDNATAGIAKLLIANDRMLASYLTAIRRCKSWDMGNRLSMVLPDIRQMTDQQIDEVIDAFNNNTELRGAFGFNGTKPTYWGDGLVSHLHRWGNRRWEMHDFLISPVD